jgi:Tfp pilus assembly protein PilF
MAKIGVVRASTIAGANAGIVCRGLLAGLGASMLAACAAQTGDLPASALNSQNAFSPAAVATTGDSARGGTSSDGADAVYRKAIEEHPEMANAQTPLGQALLESGDPALALRYFDGARKLDPGNVDNMIGAGRARMALQEPHLAQKEFAAALKKEPANVRALIGMGVALDAQKKHDQAQKHYEKALRLEPGNRSLRNNYGLSLGLSGSYERAMAELSPLAQADDEAGKKAKQNMARLYAMRGDSATASQWTQTKTGPGE